MVLIVREAGSVIRAAAGSWSGAHAIVSRRTPRQRAGQRPARRSSTRTAPGTTLSAGFIDAAAGLPRPAGRAFQGRGIGREMTVLELTFGGLAVVRRDRCREPLAPVRQRWREGVAWRFAARNGSPRPEALRARACLPSSGASGGRHGGRPRSHSQEPPIRGAHCKSRALSSPLLSASAGDGRTPRSPTLRARNASGARQASRSCGCRGR